MPTKQCRCVHARPLANSGQREMKAQKHLSASGVHSPKELLETTVTGKGGRSVLSFRQGGGSNPELTPTVHIPHFGPKVPI